MTPTYDLIGHEYSSTRRADPRIVSALVTLLNLSPHSTIADIGAGTGNYTRAIADQGHFVEAVEPSAVMRSQSASHSRVRWHTGTAESLPLGNCSVQGCISTLAIHHFSDLNQAIREMSRVTGNGPFVFLTFDYRLVEPLWLADYFPKLWQDAVQSLPPLDAIATIIKSSADRNVEILPFLLPLDLVDMFLAAGWQQPEVYLDSTIRAGISSFAFGDSAEIQVGLERLSSDINCGAWDTKYGWVKSLHEIDAGYRFVRVTVP